MLYINYIIYTLDCRLKHYKMNRKECKIQDMNRLGVKPTHLVNTFTNMSEWVKTLDLT